MKTHEDIKASIRILKMVLFLFVYIHFYTCVWWLTVKTKKNWIQVLHTNFEKDFYKMYQGTVTQ